VISVKTIIDRLDRHQPELVDSPPSCQAEVALILGAAPSAKDPQMIFIQRSVYAGDPWSGQMAFPGGRREESDLHDGDAARRETLEEIGLELRQHELVGRLGDLRGRHGGQSQDLLISCFVFAVDKVPALTPNHEVSQVVSVPLSCLLDPSLQTRIRYEQAGGQWFPGIFVGQEDERVVWGLTYRFLWQLFSLLGHTLPTE
tara:strand:+ start:417 stop:1019 length:603 start_codon:yes stop_codon:yes gene_type:complete